MIMLITRKPIAAASPLYNASLPLTSSCRPKEPASRRVHSAAITPAAGTKTIVNAT